MADQDDPKSGPKPLEAQIAEYMNGGNLGDPRNWTAEQWQLWRRHADRLADMFRSAGVLVENDTPTAGPGTLEARSGRKDLGPTKMLGVKVPIPVFNRFVDFCQRERLSYWEGIKELMDRVGVREDGRIG